MRRRKRYRWNRTLFSAASLVLWCQAAGRFGLVADRVALPVLVGKEIYPFCWAMILGLACLITVRQVTLERLMKPSIRTLRGLDELWPEWLILGVSLIASGRTRLGWGQGIAIAGGVLCEEAVFRMMFCSDCLRQDRLLEPKTIVLLSASLWSAAHLLNVLGGVPLETAVMQCVSTFGNGLLLGIVFLRTGSVWPMVLAHFAHNLVMTSIDRTRLEEFAASGDLSWKCRLLLAAWVTGCMVWVYVLWAGTERKEVEPAWGMQYNEVKEEQNDV